MTHWRTMTISRPNGRGREWSLGPRESCRHHCGCICVCRRWPPDSHTAFRKGMQPLPTYDSEGKEPGRSTPRFSLFDLLPVCLTGGTTLEPKGKEAHESLPGTEHGGEGWRVTQQILSTLTSLVLRHLSWGNHTNLVSKKVAHSPLITCHIFLNARKSDCWRTSSWSFKYICFPGISWEFPLQRTVVEYSYISTKE